MSSVVYAPDGIHPGTQYSGPGVARRPRSRRVSIVRCTRPTSNMVVVVVVGLVGGVVGRGSGMDGWMAHL